MLSKQEFIELFRNGNVTEAVAFAVISLAPLGQHNVRDIARGCFRRKNTIVRISQELWLQELEQTMALLAFPENFQHSQHFLLSQEQRLEVAEKINRLILRTQENKNGT